MNSIKSKFWPWCNWIKWIKVFKNGPTKICRRQPLKNFPWSILEYFDPNLNDFWPWKNFPVLLALLNVFGCSDINNRIRPNRKREREKERERGRESERERAWERTRERERDWERQNYFNCNPSCLELLHC